MRPPGSSFASRIAVRFFLHFSMQHLPLLPHINGVSQGCPNLLCFATFSASLELRPLSSAGITRPLRYYGPFRHPLAPFLIVTDLRLVVTTDHAIGLPVLRALSLCTCCRHYPGAATGRTLRSFTQPYQPSPIGSSGRPAHRPFRGLLGVHSRCGLHTRAVTVFRDTLHRRLQPFRYLHSCSGCFRLERLPGGTCTHWESGLAPDFRTT